MTQIGKLGERTWETMDLMHLAILGGYVSAAWLIVRLWSRVRELRASAARQRGELELAASLLGELQETTARFKRHKEEFFGIIEGLEKERDQWRRLYETNAQLAGNAQQWLFRAVDRLHRIANSYAQQLGKPPVPADPTLETLQEALAERPQLPTAAPGFQEAQEALKRQAVEVASP